MSSSVLVLLRVYLPGYKAGGPVQSIANLVSELGEQIDFRIVALDRDVGETVPYPGVTVNTWCRHGGGSVFYIRADVLLWWRLFRLWRSAIAGTAYLNSVFSLTFTLFPLLLRHIGVGSKRTLLIAPRGQFSPGALVIKGLRKRIYLSVLRRSGLVRDVIWHASDEYEAALIKKQFGEVATVMIAPPLSTRVAVQSVAGGQSTCCVRMCWRPKVQGSLRVVFLSRICRKKNVLAAIQAVTSMGDAVTLDIYGPIEDQAYWDECRRLYAGSKHIAYKGEVSHSTVAHTLADYDLFFLPTFGENYGHVIAEALVAGCPVLISDQTPWRDLESHGVGWDIPVTNLERFRFVLEYCAALGPCEYSAFRKRAYAFGKAVVNDPARVEANRRMFTAVTRHCDST